MPANVTAIPAAEDSNPPPIPGKPGHRQAPVVRMVATSWIESNHDPTAYMPLRMIDGDETTSYQFSTKAI